MDTGAAVHVMHDHDEEILCSREQSETWVRKLCHSRPLKECTGAFFCSANVVKPLISMGEVVQAGSVVVLDEKNPLIRNNRDGTVIKLDANNGVYTMDMWMCLDETGPVFSWQGQ